MTRISLAALIVTLASINPVHARNVRGAVAAAHAVPTAARVATTARAVQVAPMAHRNFSSNNDDTDAHDPVAQIQEERRQRAEEKGTWVGNRPARHRGTQPAHDVSEKASHNEEKIADMCALFGLSREELDKLYQEAFNTASTALPIVIDPTTMTDQEIYKVYVKKGAWGMHLSLNLEDCDPTLIRSEEAVDGFSYQLCDHIGMKRFLKPRTMSLSDFVDRIEDFGDCPEVAGITAEVYAYDQIISNQLIETSSITTQTIPGLLSPMAPIAHFANKTGNVYLDIFSCKPYSAQLAILFAVGYFKAQRAHAVLQLR